MQVHAGTGAPGEGLRHEAGRASVPRRDAAHGTLEQDGLVDGTQCVGSMLERDLELAGRVFGHQRADRQALLARRRVEIVEQR